MVFYLLYSLAVLRLLKNQNNLMKNNRVNNNGKGVMDSKAVNNKSSKTVDSMAVIDNKASKANRDKKASNS